MSDLLGGDFNVLDSMPLGIIPGQLDDTARYAFTAGGCGSLALCLHERTGWPVWAVCSALQATEGFYPYADRGGYHFAVLHPCGLLLDIEGLSTPDQLAARFADQAAGSELPLVCVPTSADDLDQWEWVHLLVPADISRTFVAPLLTASAVATFLLARRT